MTRTIRVKKILEYFEEHHPDASTELRYSTNFELLVAVILSAQCTDKRVNLVTPELFARFPDVYAMASAEQDEIFPYIKSISYPNSKSKHLSAMAKKVVNVFKGQIPESVNELKSLPGVGQKTANVIVSVVFGIPAMPVDTHVFRVSARLGLTPNAKTPEQTEKILVRLIPSEKLSIAHHWLILHGRYVCMARKPKCGSCELQEFCKYYSTQAKKNIRE